MGEYSTVTELPGYKAHKEQMERLFQRYHFACEYGKDGDILEVACGGGIGLGYLARHARWVIGGDIDEKVLEFARGYYRKRRNIEIKTLDAQHLPFADKSFDEVLLYEAIYYIPQPERFVDEARRVLRDNGVLIVCTDNKDWSGFNPSPYSYRYFSVPELCSLLEKKGFEIRMFASFSSCSNSSRDKIISFIKEVAVKLHLIPKTMKGKEKLKRLFFGKLQPLPSELTDGMADYIPPVPIPNDIPDKDHKVVYAVGHVK